VEVVWTGYPREIITKFLDGISQALNVACTMVKEKECHGFKLDSIINLDLRVAILG
jgi:hypothetical protein